MDYQQQTGCQHPNIRVLYTVCMDVVVEGDTVTGVDVLTETTAFTGDAICGVCGMFLPEDHPAVLSAREQDWPAWDIV